MAHLHGQHAGTHEQHPPATRGRLIRWAKYYDPFVSLFALGRRMRFRRAEVAPAQLQPGERVLEVGCGTGDVALVAATQVGGRGSVHGIDPSPEMIAVARGKAARAGAAADFQVGVIEALAFPDHSFDVVLSSLMMHHLPDDLKPLGLAEIARVLKPGGRLLIVDFKRRTGRLSRALGFLMPHHALQTGIEDLAPLLRAAGFTSIDEGEVGFLKLGFVRGQTRR